MHYLFLLIAIVAEVIGTSALKAAEGFTQPWPSLLVIVSYAAAFYFLSLTLSTIPVGVAYAVWSGLGITLIALVGWLVYCQPLDRAGMLGIGLILAGVLVLQLFSRAGTH